ncbi:sulfatase family protein [Carboxylicivirga sp. RSCT41]|uniref:sulfatase family protein n=1 Tax=Carboxylicivirga agarovorans TaxID=3417570 RepID=UPI003D34DFD0
MDSIRLRLFLIIITLSCFSIQSDAQEKYNILWLSCEDIGPVLGAYGTSGIETPNIDRLANEGILYKQAYATVGVCAPSRASIITGMYPVSVGTHNMRTGNHWGYSKPEDEQYERCIKVKDKNGRNVPQYSVVPPSFVRCFSEYLREAGYYCTNNAKCDYQFNCPITAWDEVGNNAHYKNRADGQSFFAVFNHGVTHESQIWKRQDEAISVDTAQIHIPAYYADIPLVRRDVGRKYSNIELLDQQIGEWLQKLEDENLLDKTIIFFWSDHGGPLLRQKRAVGNSGLHVPLIVRFPDKRMAGTVVDDIVSLMDLGPTVMSLAGLETPQYMHGKAFLGQYKSDEPHQYAFGSADRFDEHTQMSRSVIDGRYIYIRNYMTDQPYTYPLFYREQIEMTSQLIRMNDAGELAGDARYIFQNSLPYEELYDLETDPDEVHNLANDPAHQTRLKELRKALYQWQLSVNDKGFIPEHDLVNMMWPGGIQPETEPVEFIRQGKTIELKSATTGASIAYQLNDAIGSDQWQLYSQPLKAKNAKIAARAVRIGYKTSPITLSE